MHKFAFHKKGLSNKKESIVKGGVAAGGDV
jgi:hypothetical protein